MATKYRHTYSRTHFISSWSGCSIALICSTCAYSGESGHLWCS